MIGTEKYNVYRIITSIFANIEDAENRPTSCQGRSKVTSVFRIVTVYAQHHAEEVNLNIESVT